MMHGYNNKNLPHVTRLAFNEPLTVSTLCERVYRAGIPFPDTALRTQIMAVNGALAMLGVHDKKNGDDSLPRIKTIEWFRVKPRWLFVKITDESGGYGWGEATLEGHDKAVEGALSEMADRLLGYVAEYDSAVITRLLPR